MRLSSLVVVVILSVTNIASADTFDEGGANEFTIDFVNISGDASSANGTNISQFSSGEDGYKTFTDPSNDYRIGTYEITNDQFAKFAANTPNFTGADVPANMISWYEGAQFVNYLNTSTGHQAAYNFTGSTFSVWESGDAGYDSSNPYRNSNAFYFLPTEDEWVKAAYWNGTSLQIYATKAGESLTQGDGTSGTGWNYYDGEYATDPSGTWDVGSGSEELNGTFDMMGNVREWMESPRGSGDYLSGSDRGVRGGSYVNIDYNLSSSYRHYGSVPYSEGITLGFRVASAPEPTTLLLLGLGGLLIRKRSAH